MVFWCRQSSGRGVLCTLGAEAARSFPAMDVDSRKRKSGQQTGVGLGWAGFVVLCGRNSGQVVVVIWWMLRGQCFVRSDRRRTEGQKNRRTEMIVCKPRARRSVRAGGSWAARGRYRAVQDNQLCIVSSPQPRHLLEGRQMKQRSSSCPWLALVGAS